MNEEYEIDEEELLEELKEGYDIIYDRPEQNDSSPNNSSESEESHIRPLDEAALKWLCDNHELVRNPSRHPSKENRPNSHMQRLYEFEKSKREITEYNRSVPEELKKPLPKRKDYIKRDK